MRLLAGPVLAALLAAALAPTAAAAEDNAAHRYMVYGRVVDNASQPIRDLLVDVGLPASLGTPEDCPVFPNAQLEALGNARTQRRTTDHGDFLFCFHVHEIPRDVGPGAVRIESAGFADAFALDPVARVTFLNLQLPVALPHNRTSALERNYTVIAHVYHPGETVLEGVAVLSVPAASAPVEVLADFGNGVIKAQTRTNAYGGIAIDFPLTARPTRGTIQVDSAGGSVTLPVEPVTGMTGFLVEAPPPKEPLPAPAVIAMGLLAVALIGGVAWSVARRSTNK